MECRKMKDMNNIKMKQWEPKIRVPEQIIIGVDRSIDQLEK
jgi:hypothetical protein